MSKKQNGKPSSGRLIAALRAVTQELGYEDVRIELLKGGAVVVWVKDDGKEFVWDCHSSIHALARSLKVAPPPEYDVGKKVMSRIRAVARKAGYWGVRVVAKRKEGVRLERGEFPIVGDHLLPKIPATLWRLWLQVNRTEDLHRRFP